MPFTKTFGTTAGAYSTNTLWRANSLRTPSFAWTASGSGTAEYYVRTSGGADPGFVASPPTSNGVFINGSAATKASLGSLAAGNWGYGDNDTLGYSTVYVRLSDGTDPDSKELDYVYFKQIPQTGEHVRWAVDSASINSATGLDQSSVAIGDFIVEEGCQASFGSESLGYLSIDPNRFEFNGQGEAWLNLTTANIPVQIYGTANPGTGERGLYLRGSNLTVINIMGGNVGLAIRPGETTTATHVRLLGTNPVVALGNGVTLTNLHQYSGEAFVSCGVTTTILYGGRLTSLENGAMTTVTQHGGEYVWRSSGNVTTFNMYGGLFDMQQSGAARTLSTFNKYRGSLQILHNKEAVTVTTETRNDTYAETVSP
jgi:hypothetical protein